MRYCTLDDLALAIPLATLIALSNDDAHADAVNQGVIERAVTQAEELIDASLRGRYQLPMAEVPTPVTEMTVTLARHWLYARRPEGGELPDAVVRTYSATLKMLDQIRTGALTLGLPSGEKAKAPARYKRKSSRRRFGDDVLDTQP